jgi:hypothetical protein
MKPLANNLPTVKESLKSLLSGLSDIKENLIDKLRSYDSQTFAQVTNYLLIYYLFLLGS